MHAACAWSLACPCTTCTKGCATVHKQLLIACTMLACDHAFRERSPVGERVNQGPLSFKQFLLNQSDDPSPDEAQERYRQYLVEYHGSEIKAEFMQTRNDER